MGDMHKTTKAHRDRPRICLVAVEESSIATVMSLHEVFGTLQESWVELTGETTFKAPFEVLTVGASRKPMRHAGGTTLTPEATFAEITSADAVIVPDLAISPDQSHSAKWPEARAWLTRIHGSGGIICSVCDGSIMLAGAGLLDRRPATTHWGFVEHFRRWYPNTIILPERVLVTVPPDDRIVTAGGNSSWQDLALYLIARFQGEAAAINTAKLFLFGDRSEGQLLYAAMVKPLRHEDAAISRAQEWLAEHYAEDHPVRKASARSGLADRTFKRRFRSATGFSPIDYVQALRVEEAKQMLEMTADPVDQVATEVGYEDPASFRRLFKRTTGVTPSRYRQRFRDIAKSG